MSVITEDQQGYIWLDGSLVAWSEARLHVLSHSLHFASAVFEGIRVYGGGVFKLEAHIDRLFKSAELVGMALPFEKQEICRASTEVVAVQGLSEGYIRPIAWRGVGSMAPTFRSVPVHIAIAAWDWPVYYSEAAKSKGIRLTVSNWRRPPPETAPVHAKTSGLYTVCSIAKNEAERDGFDDALLLDTRGYISETTSSNIFFVMDESLLTPVPDCFLNGITRLFVIELARELGIEVKECHLSMSDIGGASEAFVTGTAAEITPVAQIGQLNFKPGLITSKLMKSFSENVPKHLSAPADR